MRTWILATSASMIFVGPALAEVKQPDRELATCAAETNSVKRLECYDGLAKKRGVAEPDTKLVTAGKWQVHTSTSKIDDSQNVTLMLDANETVHNHIGLRRETPEIHIYCRDNRTMFFVLWKVYLGIDETQMTHRIDKAKAVEGFWDISTDHTAVGKGSGRAAIPFIKSLFGKEQFLARITPYGANSLTVTFDIAGLEEAVKPLRKACNW